MLLKPSWRSCLHLYLPVIDANRLWRSLVATRLSTTESGLGQGGARDWFFCPSAALACQSIGRPGSKSQAMFEPALGGDQLLHVRSTCSQHIDGVAHAHARHGVCRHATDASIHNYDNTMRRPDASRTSLPSDADAGQDALPEPRRVLDGADNPRGQGKVGAELASKVGKSEVVARVATGATHP